MRAKIIGALRVIRVRHWVKNFFVFIPIFFGGAIFDVDQLGAGAVTWMAFCFAASAIYCLNDIIDVEADRAHPVKCNRPIASGAISVGEAYLMMGVMVALSMAMLSLLTTAYASRTRPSSTCVSWRSVLCCASSPEVSPPTSC